MELHQIDLRPANQKDMPFLLELRRQTMNAHLLASGIIPSSGEHERRVFFRFDRAQIVELGNEPIGLLKVIRDGKHWHLAQIQLIPSLQGQGLGTRIVRSVIAQAVQAGASLGLSVLKANPALRLYERLGFVVVSENSHAFEMRLGTVRDGI
jgi:ribosomal protein S18 acetylase RimI-like enzyme